MAADAEDGVHAALPADLTAPRQARELTRGALRRWSLLNLLEPVTLAVSELVANAVRHGRPPVALSLNRRRGRVHVEVHDEAPAALVEQQSPAEDAESGRGLLIVQGLAEDVGVQEIDHDGKVVWADFKTDQDAAPAADADGPAGTSGT
jgi:anti-sigma regulatory factor (Ser/Thr protein kinase)